MNSNYENADKKQVVCGYCCYYLEHESKKKNHVAVKRGKYENVVGLVAY